MVKQEVKPHCDAKSSLTNGKNPQTIEYCSLPMTQTFRTLVFHVHHHLRRCIADGDHTTGRILHALLTKNSLFPTSTFLSNLLLHVYATKSLTLANHLFDEIPDPNIFTYNCLLSAYTRHHPSALHVSHAFFHQIPDPDIVSYNTLLSAHATGGDESGALAIFSRMRITGVEVDGFTLSALVSVLSCGVEQLHCLVVKAGFVKFVSVNNAMISSYSRTGSLETSRRIYDEMGSDIRDGVSWNCMIMAYGKHGEGAKALRIFRQMGTTGIEVDVFTLASVLTAFTTTEDLDGGFQFHGHLIKSAFQKNSHVGSGLVDLYSRCGRILDAEKVFDEVIGPDLVLWNAMIHGYSLAASKFSEDAFLCFREMQRSAVLPDWRSFVSVTSACSSLPSVAQGMQIHSLVLKMELSGDQVSVNNALIAVYSKFGNLGEARQLFERMKQHDTVSFNSMIAGYAQHGLGAEAITLFEQLLASNTLAPTSITFVSVLSACAHTGKVKDGLDYFNTMEQTFGIRPREEHYTCMIDLLGRAGEFEKVENLIEAMEFDPGIFGWTALLSSCRTHGNFELGAKAARRLIELEPSNAAAYVTLSNMYARLGKWNEAERVRKLMRSIGLRKNSAFSWT